MQRNYNMTKEENNLFYLCSLIEYIARTTKNTKKDIVNILGKEELNKIYVLAEAYHAEPIEKISDELIAKYNIKKGNYPNNAFKHNIPSYWDIGKVYQRLIIMNSDGKENYINSLIEVLTSWIIPKIDNYDSSMYYENPSYIYACYQESKIL